MTDNKKETYSARAVCRNCKSEKVIAVPFGIEMSLYESKIKCDYCGCSCMLKSTKEW